MKVRALFFPLASLVLTGLPALLPGQEAAPSSKVNPTHLKEEMRMPWSRSNERFIRRWLVLGDIPSDALPTSLKEGAPLPVLKGFETDWLIEHGGEASIKPVEKMTHKYSKGPALPWRAVTAWGDETGLSDGVGLNRDLIAYAFTTVVRPEAGKALLCLGSDGSIRVWFNGSLLLDRRTNRPHTFDEEQIEVEMKSGENTLLIKSEQNVGPWTISARVLESGSIPPKIQEISPSLRDSASESLVVKTDASGTFADRGKVTVQVIGAGGKYYAEKTERRGEILRFDPSGWPDGAYEVRCITPRLNGLLYATHLPWYRGDAMVAARALIAAGSQAETGTLIGAATKMLADLVVDRLGGDITKVAGNPWWAIHSPLMEFEEMQLEANGAPAMVRPYGFVRLAYADDLDGSTQFCRAYLPGGYDPAKKWPLVVRLHGYNPDNPEYVRWWSVDARHLMADVEYAGHQGIIYMEPHGRGNNRYLGLGDQDVTHVIQQAKMTFNIDPDRVYLMGESMGGWGTWNVATRHPDLFAAIAPIYGGADYHSQMPEEALSKLTPLDQFFQEKDSSWAMAESLLNLPILVHHGDVDQSVKVEYSRYGVRLLERWGYNVRYIELPGYGHEELNIFGNVVNWLLQYRRDANPNRVRLRSAELQNAQAYWVKVEQAASPRDFMVVDAEITGLNAIRFDTQNVLAVVLSPVSSMIDPSQPIKVRWNGKPIDATLEKGRLRLQDVNYLAGSQVKSSKVAGPISDIFNTPFAIVIGTSSTDPAMNEICRRKAEAVVAFWKQWQHQSPRVYKDSELSDEEASRYSLLLIGGPNENLAFKQLGGKIPLEIFPDRIKVGPRSFEAADARIQMIYPNPLNRQRYLLTVAATSADGMVFWTPNHVQNAEFDFLIQDGHLPAGNQLASPVDFSVVSGWFDPNWNLQDTLLYSGNAEARAKGIWLRAPRPDRLIPTQVLDSYVGNYEIMPGFIVKIVRKDNLLIAQAGSQPPMELAPASETEFVILEGPVQIVFVKDANGKTASLKGWQNGREFTAKKVD